MTVLQAPFDPPWRHTGPLKVSLYKGSQALPHGHVWVHGDLLLCTREGTPAPQRDRAGPSIPPEQMLLQAGTAVLGGSWGLAVLCWWWP